MNDKKMAIGRLIALLIIMLNQGLVTFGFNPLPFSDDEIYEGVSIVLTAVAAVVVWYKNNNITDEAVEAQKVLDTKKKVKK